MQNDYELSRSPKPAEIIRAKNIGDLLSQVIIGISLWATENGYTEPINYVFEDGANGKGHILDSTSTIKKAIDGQRFLIGAVAFDTKNRFPQLHSADKLIQQSCRAIAQHIQGKEVEESVIRRLIKAKLGKVYRFDSENLPLLRAYSDSAQLEREGDS